MPILIVSVIVAIFLPSTIHVPERTIIISSEEVKRAQDPVEIIKAVADEKGIDQVDLLAVSYQESLLGKLKVGDHGCSLGYFHINTCARPDAKALIGDVRKEATYAANLLVQYGYSENKKKAFARYNAPNNPNWEYAERVEGRRKQVIQYVD